MSRTPPNNTNNPKYNTQHYITNTTQKNKYILPTKKTTRTKHITQTNPKKQYQTKNTNPNFFTVVSHIELTFSWIHWLLKVVNIILICLDVDIEQHVPYFLHPCISKEKEFQVLKIQRQLFYFFVVWGKKRQVQRKIVTTSTLLSLACFVKVCRESVCFAFQFMCRVRVWVGALGFCCCVGLGVRC